MPEIYEGPRFTRVEEIHWQELVRRGGFGSGSAPILVKGAVKAWPAYDQHRIFIVTGGPGAGKSTLLAELAAPGQDPPNHILINGGTEG